MYRSRTTIVLLLFLVAIFLKGTLAFPQHQKLDSLQLEYNEAVTDSARVYLLVEMSDVYRSKDVIESIEFAQKALDVANSNNNKSLKAFAMFNLGNALFTQGLFENATNYFYQYLDIQKQKKDLVGEAYALANIGAVHLKMENLEEARISFLQALNLLQQYVNKHQDSVVSRNLPNILNNLGVVYQARHEYDSALFYYRKGLHMASKLTQKEYFQENIFNNIGSLFLESNQPDSARKPLFTALKMRKASNDFNGLAASSLRLGDYFFTQNLPQKALEYIYRAYGYANKTGSTDLKRQSAGKLYKYYYKNNQPDSALKHYMAFNAYSDTINNIKTQKELTRLKLLTKHREEKRVAEVEQKRKQAVFLFTGLLLTAVLLIFVLLYYLSSNKLRRVRLERNNLELVSKNTTLEKKNLENELEIKKKELTTNVLSLIRKNELIRQTIDELSKKSLSKDDGSKGFIRSVINDLNRVQDESIWDEFEKRYNEVDAGFYEKLGEINPNLTNNERRLCAFLRLNMTTKEISSITGQSLRSIEVARTRLRKKLQLTNSNTRLVDFLVSL